MGKDKDLEASKEGTELDAIIVGAGFSGIASACRIQMDLGLSKFLIFEKLAKSYRPISLLSSASKLYERILAARLQYIGREGALSRSHYGAVPGRSAEDALETIRQAGMDARVQHRRAAMTGVDVKGAFDNAQHKLLITAMKESLDRTSAGARSYRRLINACQDWLRVRSVSLSFNKETGKEYSSGSSSVGIPQGSPLSPVLWLYYVNPLLVELETRWNDGDVLPVCYVDDLSVIATGNTDEAVVQRLRDINTVVRSWSKGARVGLDKAFLLPLSNSLTGDARTHYLNALATVGLSSDHPAALSSIVSTNAKILGLQLQADGAQTNTMQAKKATIAKCIGLLSPMRHSTTAARFTLAMALLFPRLEYGMTAMLPVSSKTEEEMEDMDFRILSWIAGFRYKTTKKWMSYMYLCYAFGVLPVMERVWLKARKGAMTRHGMMRTIKTTYPPAGQGNHGPTDMARQGSTYVSTRKMTCPWLREVAFDSIAISSTKEAAQEYHDQVMASFDGVRVYTDGSQQGTAIGSGYAVYLDEVQHAAVAVMNENRLFDTSYHAELIALDKAMRHVAVLESIRKRSNGKLPSIMIGTDSQSSAYALRTPAKWQSEHPLSSVAEAAAALRDELDDDSTLHLVWIPGHRNIEGNEAADVLADKAALQTIEWAKKNRQTPVQHAYLTEALATAWARARGKFDPGRTVTSFGVGYGPKHGKELRSMKLKLTAAETRQRLIWLGGYAFLRGAQHPKECSKCSQPLLGTVTYETHLILQCERTAAARKHFDLLRKEDDKANDWLFWRPKLNKFLDTLDPLRASSQSSTYSMPVQLVNPYEDLPEGDSQDDASIPIVDNTLVGSTVDHRALADEEDDQDDAMRTSTSYTLETALAVSAQVDYDELEYDDEDEDEHHDPTAPLPVETRVDKRLKRY